MSENNLTIELTIYSGSESSRELFSIIADKTLCSHDFPHSEFISYLLSPEHKTFELNALLDGTFHVSISTNVAPPCFSELASLGLGFVAKVYSQENDYYWMHEQVGSYTVNTTIPANVLNSLRKELSGCKRCAILLLEEIHSLNTSSVKGENPFSNQKNNEQDSATLNVKSFLYEDFFLLDYGNESIVIPDKLNFKLPKKKKSKKKIKIRKLLRKQETLESSLESLSFKVASLMVER